MTIASLAPRIPARLAARCSILRDPDYRRFWLSGVLDESSGWLLFTIQGWLLLNLTHRPQTVVLFFVMRMAPRALFALPAGALCDRIGGLPLLRAARVAGAAPALLIGAGALAGWLTVDLLLISALLTSAMQAFERPAQRSLLHGYAGGDRLVAGIAVSGMGATMATLSAPLLLVPFLVLGDVRWALPVQAVIAAASGLVLLRTRAPRATCTPAGATLGAECWLGLRYLASTPVIIALLVLVSSPGLLDRLLTFVTPGYAHGEGAAGMTLLFLAPATGALIGGSLLAWIGDEVRRLLPIALGSSSVAVVSVGLLATSRLFLVSLLLFLLIGAAKAAFSIAVMSALQRRVPDHARGRVLTW